MKKGFMLILLLISLSSCRSKYEELLVNYNKTKERISKITQERKGMEKEIPKLTDSINSLLVSNKIWKKYFEQGEDVKKYKMNFYNEIKNGKQSANNDK